MAAGTVGAYAPPQSFVRIALKVEEAMRASKWWVVVCDAARARVFSTYGFGERMVEVEDWIEPAGRMSGRELGHDRPGRAMDRARGGRHAMEPPLEVHDKAEAAFAHAIAEWLGQAHKAGRFDQLALVASPGMLGRLRPAIERSCPGCCAFDWARELSHQSPQEIATHLAREQQRRFENPGGTSTPEALEPNVSITPELSKGSRPSGL